MSERVRRLRRVLAAAMVTGCGGAEVPSPATVGSPAPSYSAVTLAGDTVSLGALRGWPVLLNVWATWCDPCREEMPGLEQVHRQFGTQGLRVFGASIDLAAATGAITRFVDDHGVTFPILHDPQNRVSRVFQLIGVPGTVLIDRNGIIAHRWVGAFDPTSETATRVIRSVVEQAGPLSH